MGGIRTGGLLMVISLFAAGCGGDDDGGGGGDDDDGGGGDDDGGGGDDGGPANVTELPGLVPDDIAVSLPDSVQSSRRRLGGCFMTASGEQVVLLVRYIENAQGHAISHLRFVDLMAGAVADRGEDATYSEAGAFNIEVTDELAALVEAEIADYPDLVGFSPPAGLVLPSPRFCYLKNQPGDFTRAFYHDPYDFAVGAGCEDLAEYMTRFEWNDDRTRFRVRQTLYKGFSPLPYFNATYDDPIPENADDEIAGYVTYTYDTVTDREWFRMSVFLNNTTPEHPADTDILYEVSGTLEECGADECLRFRLASNNIGEIYDRVEIIAGQGDIAGAILDATSSQREGLGGVIFTDDHTILDGASCSQFHRALEADGYSEWEGDGTGDPTATPFYQEVIVDGIDFNGVAIDINGLTGLPDSDEDLPRLFVIARGGADPATDPNAAIGVGFAHHFFGDQLFTPSVYWGTPDELAEADVYEDDWDAVAQAPTYTLIPGDLAIAP